MSHLVLVVISLLRKGKAETKMVSECESIYDLKKYANWELNACQHETRIFKTNKKKTINWMCLIMHSFETNKAQGRF